MDRRGVISLPVTILVSMVIIAIAVPIIAEAGDRLSDECGMDGVRQEAEKIISSSERMWYAGAGSQEEVSVDIPQGYTVRFGGEGADQWSYAIMYGDDIREREYLDSPKIRFTASADVSGCCTVKILCLNDGGYGIAVMPE